jgi:hypothetical protein
VYLAAESYVQEICTPGGININDTFIQCRPYIMKSKRVVLSNVLPDIPNEALIQLLHTFGKPTSQISQLSISTVHPDLRHIVIQETSVHDNTRYEGVNYVIYITCDDGTCMNCHKPSHVARNCRTTAQPRMGPITFADLAAGRRYHPPPPRIEGLKHKKTDTHQ